MVRGRVRGAAGGAAALLEFGADAGAHRLDGLVGVEQDGSTVSATANLIWLRDSVVWINVKKFGIEGARALLTPDASMSLAAERRGGQLASDGCVEARTLAAGRDADEARRRAYQHRGRFVREMIERFSRV